MRTLIRSAVLFVACLLTAGCAGSRAAKNPDPTDFSLMLHYPTTEHPPEVHMITEPENFVTVVPADPIEINDATAEQLLRLPNMDSATAHRIIEYRARSGGFTSASQLMQVRGMSQALLSSIEPWITVNGEAPPLDPRRASW